MLAKDVQRMAKSMDRSTKSANPEKKPQPARWGEMSVARLLPEPAPIAQDAHLVPGRSDPCLSPRHVASTQYFVSALHHLNKR